LLNFWEGRVHRRRVLLLRRLLRVRGFAAPTGATHRSFNTSLKTPICD
jgi:hypothetical protein